MNTNRFAAMATAVAMAMSASMVQASDTRNPMPATPKHGMSNGAKRTLGAVVGAFLGFAASYGVAQAAFGNGQTCGGGEDGCLVTALASVTIGTAAGGVIGALVAPSIGKKADLAMDEGRARVRESIARRQQESSASVVEIACAETGGSASSQER